MKGQVTIFIIIGIVLVLTVGTFVVLLDSEETIQDIRIDTVPSEYSPIQNYVHGCLLEKGTEAIAKIGEGGGYINDDTFVRTNLQPGNPAESNSFYFFPDTLIIPYWYYMEGINGPFKSEKPALKRDDDPAFSIETQIDQYTQATLEECTDFSLFEPLEIETGTPVVETLITETDVILNLEYPITIRENGKVQEIENFGVRVPVRLKDSYELAELLTESQAEFSFAEHNVLNQLTLVNGIDGEFPPISDFTFDVGGAGKTWHVEDIKENMKLLLTSRIGLLQAQGARNFNRIFTDVQDGSFETRQKVYDDMILPMQIYYEDEILENANLEGNEVSFVYLDWWEPYVNVNDETVIRPKTVGLDFPPLNLGMQQYEAYYGISWPVLIRLHDPEAFAGEGFTFQFGVEGNIRDNEPVRGEYIPRARAFDSLVDICDDGTQNVSVRVEDNNCDENDNCQPIDGASLMLKLDERVCYLGTTENGNASVLLPTGTLNGAIQAFKQDYISEQIPLDDDATGYIIRGMTKLKEIDFVVKKRVMEKRGSKWILTNKTEDLTNRALVQLQRYSFDDEGPHSLAFQVESSEPTAQLMVDGIYDVEITLLGKSGEQTAQTIQQLDEISDELDIPDEQKSVLAQQQLSNTEIPTGGASFILGERDNRVEFTRQMIEEGSVITLYALELKDLNIIEDGRIVGEVENLTVYYKDALIPEVE